MTFLPLKTFYSETGSNIGQAGLELALEPRQALNTGLFYVSLPGSLCYRLGNRAHTQS